MDIFHSILNKYWGYSEFREKQLDIIDSIYNNKDTLGLLPTGGGKSICFQVPALAKDGLCIVVTPLVALMKDQVQNLRQKGIKAVAVHSGMSNKEILIAYENCILAPDYKFLYLSPERLKTNLFLSKLREMSVNMLVIDEAHCISQWGYDFRPSYLGIAEVREELPDVPILALTATATPTVVSDIQEKLLFSEENVISKSFERKNLAYIVRPTEDKLKELLKIVKAIKGCSIVFVRNRKKTKEYCDWLNENGIRAHYYHAGLSNETKDLKQSEWMNDYVQVMVCTNAFGMGIDKPNVRLVVHMDAPDSLEAYFQEAGRAGRDEKKAYAVLLWSKPDEGRLMKNISSAFPKKDEIIRAYNSLGNYFQIAVGSGEGKMNNFEIGNFAKIYKFNILQLFNSLKILQRSEFIDYAEDMHLPSKVKFLISDEELYKAQVKNIFVHKITILLRSYGGLFTEYVAIDEEQLGKRLNCSADKVYKDIVELAKLGILSYIPKRNKPQITYLQPRIDIKRFKIPKAVYDDRKKDLENRISHVINYGNCMHICRSKLLLTYFGNTNIKDCGICDVCISNKKNNNKISNDECEKLMLEFLKEAQILDNIEAKFDSLNHNWEDIFKWLASNGKIENTPSGEWINVS